MRRNLPVGARPRRVVGRSFQQCPIGLLDAVQRLLTSRLAARVALTTSLLALGLVASGCGLLDPDPGDRVLIVGDSVTYQSRAPLKKDFAWADELDIKATSGLRTDELLP